MRRRGWHSPSLPSASALSASPPQQLRKRRDNAYDAHLGAGGDFRSFPGSIPAAQLCRRARLDLFNWPRTCDENVHESLGALLPVRASGDV